MPDTGAPWNIPYVAGTDLVSDWPTDSQSLATAIADGLDEAAQVLQVVHSVKTNTSSISYVEGNETAVPDYSLTITPTSATSKIFVMYRLVAGGFNAVNRSVNLAIVRDGSPVGNAAVVGNRRGANSGVVGAGGEAMDTLYADYLDSPATTSAVTYSATVHGNVTLTLGINVSLTDANDSGNARWTSSITAWEIAA